MAVKPDPPTEQIRRDADTGVDIYGVTVEGIAHEDVPTESKPWNQDPAGWRDTWKVKKDKNYKFDDIAKGRFLATLARCDRIAEACRAANIGSSRAYEVRKDDPEFAAAWDDARRTYADTVHRAAQIRAVEGVLQPVFNKDGDLVGYKVEYSDGLLTMELKRTNSEFREKQQLDLNHSGGIVSFPALPDGMTLEQYAEAYQFPEDVPDPDAPIGSEVK